MSSDNIGMYEEYLFSADKSEFLESCKNSNHLKQYIRLCHLLNQPEVTWEAVDKEVLHSWFQQSAGGDKRNLVLKRKVQEILDEKDPEAKKKLLLDFNNRFLHVGFHDSQPVAGAQTSSNQTAGGQAALKTALSEADLREMSTEAKVGLVEKSNSGLPFSVAELGQTVLKRVDLGNIPYWPTLEQLFSVLENFSQHPSAVDALLKYKEYIRSRDKNNIYYELPETYLRKLTLAQLDSLGDKNSSTNTDFTFRKVQFLKRFEVRAAHPGRP